MDDMGVIEDDGIERLPFSEGLVVLGHKGPSGYAARLYREWEAMEAALSSYHANKTLDIGCGYGRLSPWIAKNTGEYYGIDAEEKLIELAKGYYPELNFKCGLVQKLPFPDDMFDLCITWTVLQHIPDSAIEMAVSEMKRVLQPSGTIIIAEEVNEKEGRGNPFEFPRSCNHYKEIFLPLKIVNIFRRPASGLIIRFEGVSGKK